MLTYKNSCLQPLLKRANLNIFEYPLPLSPDEIRSLQQVPECDYSIIEISHKDAESTEHLFTATKKHKRRICIADSLNETTKCTLLQNGISDLFINQEDDKIIKYINELNNNKTNSKGTFIIFDDDSINRSILNNILSGFNYTPLFIASTEDIVDNVNSKDIQFILLNLSHKSLDINDLVRKSYTCTGIKGTPIIAYTDMDTSFFVHEIISGLNKLTSYILSPEELYSFLVDFLFKKEINPSISELQASILTDPDIDFSSRSVKQIYKSNEREIFNHRSIIEDDRLLYMNETIKEIENSLNKIAALKWLRMKKGCKSVPTCGVGV